MQLYVRSGAVASGGETIYWEMTAAGEEDERPVVVLSHGAGGNHVVWYQQVPAIAKHFRVLTWDSRGFGNSTNHDNAPSAQAAAVDLTTVLDSLGIEQAHLVGQSMGGWHISAFVDQHPTRALSMTYADTVGGLWTPALQAAFAEVMAARPLGQSGPEQLGLHPALWSGTADRDRAHAFLYQQLGSFQNPPMDKIGSTLNWALGHEQISALGVPVLFVAGEHDALFPAPLLAESCALIDGARYVEIPDAGHSPYFEQPASWNRAVLDFLLEQRA